MLSLQDERNVERRHFILIEDHDRHTLNTIIAWWQRNSVNGDVEELTSIMQWWNERQLTRRVLASTWFRVLAAVSTLSVVTAAVLDIARAVAH